MTIPVQARSPTLSQVLGDTVKKGLEEVHTSMPGRVESYDEVRQLVDVQPLVDQQVLEEDGTTSSVAYPKLYNVPLMFPGANGYRITFPVVKGDEVELTFAECSLEVWKANGGPVNPGDARRFNFADATAKIGLHSNKTPWTGASKTALTMGKDAGPQVVWRSGGIELGGDDASPPTEPAVLGNLQKTDFDTMLLSASNACTGAAAGCTTASAACAIVVTACGAAGPALVAPPLSALAPLVTALGTGFGALASAFSTIGTQLTALGTAFTTLRSALPNHLSGIIKLK